jgi:hypothetical protein
MKPIVTEEELKSLKLFSYYLQSHGIKSGSVTINFQECNVDYIDSFYGIDGGRAETYDAINKVFESIIENNNFEDYMEDCENYANITFNIDCVERTLEAEIHETVRGTNEMSDSVVVDELDNSLKKEFNKFFKSMEEQGDSPTATVYFNGGGDSGDIDGHTSDGIPLTRTIESYFYDWLESFYGGWEINEGSQGRFIIDSQERMLYLEFEENTEENEERDIDFQIKF